MKKKKKNKLQNNFKLISNSFILTNINNDILNF